MNERIASLYLGGGTPSILEPHEIEEMLKHAHRLFDVDNNAEITLEANPDDLSLENLRAFRSAGVNRLSIGIQSFNEEDLKMMSRAHSAIQAKKALEYAAAAGFENLSIDLIYGLPEQSQDDWLSNLEQLRQFQISHFSAYALTVEPKTQLHHLIKTQKLTIAGDDLTAAHFLSMHQWARENSFIPYEISNFCRPGHESRHNSAYWQNRPYLGLGPSAHSFDGKRTRSWNIANNNTYIRKLNSGEPFSESEILSEADLFNEYIMTSLRTLHGFSFEEINAKFGEPYLSQAKAASQTYLESRMLESTGDRIRLTIEGRLLGDRIMSDLFIIDEE